MKITKNKNFSKSENDTHTGLRRFRTNEFGKKLHYFSVRAVICHERKSVDESVSSSNVQIDAPISRFQSKEQRPDFQINRGSIYYLLEMLCHCCDYDVATTDRRRTLLLLLYRRPIIAHIHLPPTTYTVTFSRIIMRLANDFP